MVLVFGLGSGFCLVCFHCSNLFISGIDYYMRYEVFKFLRVDFIYWFCIGCIYFYQQFRTVISGLGPGPGPTRTVAKLAVLVVN